MSFCFNILVFIVEIESIDSEPIAFIVWNSMRILHKAEIDPLNFNYLSKVNWLSARKK